MDGQKRKKAYFSSRETDKKKRKRSTLQTGAKGFLCTCNFREKDCVRDAYKILNEFAEGSHGSSDEQVEDVAVNATDDRSEDISDALNKEIKELKAESGKQTSFRVTFQVVDTGVKNVIFIKSDIPSPLQLVTKIITELNTTKRQRTRFLLRLLPIEVVCRAYINDIRSKASEFLEKYFSQEPKTFSIVFNRHSNNSITRDTIIRDIAEIIVKKNPGNKANLKDPEIAVIVEVIRGFCLMAVAPDYYKYKKYNLLEICNTKENTSDIEEDNLVSTKESTEAVEELKDKFAKNTEYTTESEAFDTNLRKT